MTGVTASTGKRSGKSRIERPVRPTEPPYDLLLSKQRLRSSKVRERDLEGEADADRGRVLFSAPFRRLQNKAQVFSLETNASVRSRLTHSLEVSSIGRYVAIQALDAFTDDELRELGIREKERALITFVETACLLHDLGNPPFGHFGERAISDWFEDENNRKEVAPVSIGGDATTLWNDFYEDFVRFDGNPQGFRIVTRLQARETGDFCGLNLTATTLAATLKYPWSSDTVKPGKKIGYFRTESDSVAQIRAKLHLSPEVRHPLAYLMEAADDIAYCVSDIEDGIEKGMISPRDFAEAMAPVLGNGATKNVKDRFQRDDLDALRRALGLLVKPRFTRDDGAKTIERLTPMQDFRSGVIRFLTREAGQVFRRTQKNILSGKAGALLRGPGAPPLLEALNEFAEKSLYSSRVVRQRELTAHAVLWGLLNAYKPLMNCERGRFRLILEGALRDEQQKPITRESGLAARVAKKYLAVYDEAVRRSDAGPSDAADKKVMERIHRLRLIVDYISGMTDEFALQSYQLIAGVDVNPHRN